MPVGFENDFLGLTLKLQLEKSDDTCSFYEMKESTV
jgi:hypothetical protein